MYASEEGRRAYEQQGVSNVSNPLAQHNEQQQIQRIVKAVECEERSSMKTKLIRIAELFEMDVLSEEDALKACKTVIKQHAKVQGMKENG